MRYDDSVEPLDDRGRVVARLLADRYELLGLLGKGGFAAVYQVRSRALQRLEALKVLLERHDLESDFAKRFTQEARVAASLEHPNIVKIHDFGHAEGMFWYSMQLIQGPTLKRRLAEGGTLDEVTAARIGATLADALDYSHARGVIHRDIKPANVVLDTEGRPYLMDFGIAKVEDNLVKTQTGFLLGSPPYVSPEQIRGEPLDGRSDLYSLGITLYQSLSGSVPFRSKDAVETLSRRLTEDAPPLSESRPGLDPGLERIVMRALARPREGRFQSAGEMRDALDGFLSGSSPRSTTRIPARRSGAEIPPLPAADPDTLKLAGRPPQKREPSAALPAEGRVPAAPTPPPIAPAAPPIEERPAAGIPGKSRSLWPLLAAGGAVVAAGLALLVVPRPARRTEPPVSTPDLRAVLPLPTPASTQATPLPTLEAPTPASPPMGTTAPPEVTPTPGKAAKSVTPRQVRPPVPPDSGPLPRRIKYPADVVSDVPISLTTDLAATCTGRTVGLHLVIGEDGGLRSSKVVSTSTVPGCDAAALDAIRRYRFKPALDTEEKPIEGKLLISVHF